MGRKRKRSLRSPRRVISFFLYISAFLATASANHFTPTASINGNQYSIHGMTQALRLSGGATAPITTTRPTKVAKRKRSSTLNAARQTVAQVKSTIGKKEEKKDDPQVKYLIRLLYLAYYGSLGSLMPYLPVYYHHLGHGGQIIGLLGAVKPFTTFLVAPIWGLIADQSGNPFWILKVTFAVSLVGQLCVSLSSDASYIMGMVFLTALFNAPVKSLIDSMVMDHVQDPSSYGRLRLWGQMGFGLGSSAVGLLLSKSKQIGWPDEKTFTPSFPETLSYSPAVLQTVGKFADKCWQSLTGYKLLFLTYAGLSIPTWLCIQVFRRMDQERQAKTVKKKEESGAARISEGLGLLLHNSDALLFFFLVFVVGISSGIIENFAYVRLREVGGTGKEMGLSRLVSSLAGAPMFWFSGPLTKALGADRVIVLSLLSYVLRFLIYAYMRNPYHGLPAEALRGVTFAAFWSTGTIYAHRVSPPGLQSTMLLLLNAMYGGLGQSVGAIIGGKLQHRFGTVKTFLYSAAVDFAFVCCVIVYLSIRKDSSFKDPKPIVAKETPKTRSTRSD